jgi:prepilin-type N-terminal cleavage/methylation domain-containing protein
MIGERSGATRGAYAEAVPRRMPVLSTSRGFTLLEMMIAMAILAGSLVWLVVGMSRNVKAENHAKLMTTATFLARGKMSAFEDELYEKGFGEFEKEQTGTFEDKGFQRFGWHIVVDKVELPNTDQVQTMMTNMQQARQQLDPTAAQQQQNSSTSSANPMASGATAMSSQFGIIKDVLEQGIRRVTVTVSWYEGRTVKDVSVVTYFTDPRKVDQAIQLSIPSNLPGTGGSSGGTTGGTTGGSSGGTTKP